MGVDPNPFLSGELGTRPPGRALDLGAGEGRTTLWLAERDWHVTAVDFSDLDGLRIERAERLHVGNAVDAIVRAVKD